MELEVATQAAEWLLKLDEDRSAECRNQFAAWLAGSPRHMEEFLLVSATAGAMRGIDTERAIDVDALLKSASPNVVPLNSPVSFNAPKAAPGKYEVRPVAKMRRWRWRHAAGIAAAAILSAALGTLYVSQTDRYSTAMGEQRSFQMEDGSLLHLNTQSQVEVRYSKQAREIRLLQGEALFVVAQDRTRPFRVTAGSTVIQAVGTQFNVYRRSRETTVSVIEGRVQVMPLEHRESSETQESSKPANSAPSLLGAGEQVQISDDQPTTKPAAADIEVALAWRQRRLVFRSQRLDEIAAEFNRYNRMTIEVDGAAAEKRMSGTFNADHPDAWLEFLRQDSALEVERVAGKVVVKVSATAGQPRA